MTAYPIRFLAAAGGALLLASAGAAAAPRAALEGTWAITSSSTTLTPVAGAVPFTPEGRKAYNANRAAARRKDYGFDLTMSRCSSPGLPRLMLAPGRMRIYVRDDMVMLRHEWNRLFRQIGMGGNQRKPAPEGSIISFDRSREELLFGTMIGKSSGTWDKDVLVVTSDGFGRKPLDNALPGSDDLTLVERFTLVDEATLEDRITITDPVNFTRPWTAVVRYKRVPNAPFAEDVCLDRKDAGEAVWPR